ncbi:hypothetical protein RY831_25680 [Noviherbaspirillum sp. CPCC 100848]|uniref:Lipoprotein n=1 Tax=Noviherbaspirillum album TaxID=3080276 RepID=A0ABU6JH91_9BURK|nr:hypothetical protein [Noviherbaspirillum sp. CPCC 100848]MEC4722562.1 hypothetical protein [Noviherbaspirillum sp. CPCC 100848]
MNRHTTMLGAALACLACFVLLAIAMLTAPRCLQPCATSGDAPKAPAARPGQAVPALGLRG